MQLLRLLCVKDLLKEVIEGETSLQGPLSTQQSRLCGGVGAETWPTCKTTHICAQEFINSCFFYTFTVKHKHTRPHHNQQVVPDSSEPPQQHSY